MQVIEDICPIDKQLDALAKGAGAERFGTLPVVHRPNLFTPKRELVQAGLTIAQIIESIDTLPASFWERGVVTIDTRDGKGSEIVPRSMWRYVKPKPNSIIPIEVNLWLPPEDEGTRKIIGLVATIAVIVAATFITGGGLGPAGLGLLGSAFASGGIGAIAAGAAVAVAGQLAIRALSPPPSISALSNGGGVSNPAQPASLSGNILRAGAMIPHVRGRRKIYPPFIVKPLTELVGDDEFATAVLGLSGAHDLDNIRVDGVSIADMEDVEYEVREGHSSDTIITLVERQSKTDASVITLSQHKIDTSTTTDLEDQTTPTNSIPFWHAMRADGSPDEIWINLRWPTGLFDGDNPTDEMVTPVRVRIREVGDTDWINLPEVHFAYRKQEPFQKDVRLKWGTAPALPTPKVTRCPYAAYSAVPARQYFFITDMSGSTNVNDGSLSTTATKASSASAYIGANWADALTAWPRPIFSAVIFPHTTNGFTGATNITINLRAKATAPANAADGVLLGTTGSIADTTTPQRIVSSDQATSYRYVWFELIPSTNATVEVAEAMFFDDGEWSWLAHPHFWTGLSNRLMRDSTIGTTEVRNIALYEDRADIWLDPTTFPQGDYEIEIKRGAVVAQSAFTETTYVATTTSTNVTDLFRWFFDGVENDYELPRDMANVQYQMQRQRLSLIWNEHPLPDAPGNLALLAIKLRNRQAGEISVDAARYVNDWNGSAWATQSTTANPAAHVRDILAGDLNADPVPDDLIDDASLVAWRTRCTSDGREINAVIEGASAAVVAQLAAGCGFGRIRQSETFGVIEDYDRSLESPVQTFTSRNSRGYRFEKSFARLPSGFRCIYGNAADDYKETELLVEDPDGDGSAIYEEVRYDGLVTEAEVEERALFDLKQARLRMALHSFDANGQAIKCQRGDLIGLNHPVLEAQMGAGYVREILMSGSNVTGLVLDGTVPLGGTGGLVYEDLLVDDMFGDGLLEPDPVGAVIRLHDGEGELTAEIVATGARESRTIMFDTPIAGPIDGLDRDCLVTVGSLGEERLRLILGEIQPKAGPSYPATLVAVDEAQALWS